MQKAYIYIRTFNKAIILRKSFEIPLDIYYLEIDFIDASSSVLIQLDGQHRTFRKEICKKLVLRLCIVIQNTRCSLQTVALVLTLACEIKIIPFYRDQN